METQDTNQTTFGERLEALRAEKNLSIGEMSYSAKIPYAALRGWMKDGRSPNLDAKTEAGFARLCDLLETPPSWLLLGIGKRRLKRSST